MKHATTRKKNTLYKEAKKRARKEVQEAKFKDLDMGAEEVNTLAGKKNICKIANQMAKKPKDSIGGGKCLRVPVGYMGVFLNFDVCKIFNASK